ncbi:MAG: carbohydrate-binding protein, partial [Bacteroidaceae bacterium]|nr:carbohydrate-binding protein [Bacteroidaceae bacterium]
MRMSRKAALLCLGLTSALSGFSQNPISQTEFTADPAPLVVGDTLYLYTGHDEREAPPTRFIMHDYLCFTTTDM